MNAAWKVGDVVCLMREGEEIERRKVAYQARILGSYVKAFVLQGIDEIVAQKEWERRGWELVQEGER